MTAELALTTPNPTMDEVTLRVMMAAADRYVKSGLLPQEVNTPQKALVVMTAGRELGVPATYALRNIHVVKGKVTCSAELMLALVRRTYGPSAIRVARTSNEACTVQYREQGWDGVSEYTFTIDDARMAGVANSTTWKSYPAAMLRARCISAVVRFAFPEAIAGLYTPEELGADVEVTDDGHVAFKVIEATPSESVSGDIPVEPGWTPVIRKRWDSLKAEALALGIEDPIGARPPDDADRKTVTEAGQKLGAAINARRVACEAFEALTRQCVEIGIDVEILDPKTLPPAELAATHIALQQMLNSVTADQATFLDDDEDTEAF